MNANELAEDLMLCGMLLSRGNVNVMRKYNHIGVTRWS